MLTTYHKTV
jgi:hypothetical protein